MHASPPPPSNESPDDRRPDDAYSGSTGFQQFVLHVVDEMPWRVVFAFEFIVFFFFYGAANSLIKLTGRDLSSIEFPIGVATGAVCALLALVAIIIAKRRRR